MAIAELKIGDYVRVVAGGWKMGEVGRIIQISPDNFKGIIDVEYCSPTLGWDPYVVDDLEVITDEEAMVWKLQN